MKSKTAQQQKSVTLLDVATRCGVNKTTVSRALRRDPRISAATTARVLQAARDMGYDPNFHHAARRMAHMRHGMRMVNRAIAIVFLPDFFKTQYHTRIFHSLLSEVARLDFMLVTAYTPQSMDRYPDLDLPELLFRGDVDGLVMMQHEERLAPALEQLQHSPGFGHRPVVNMMHQSSICSSVIPDDFSGAYQAASHLLGLGHRHILLLQSIPDRYPETMRKQAIYRAFLDAGLGPEQYMHPYPIFPKWISPFFDRDPELIHLHADADLYADELAAFLRAHPEITAVIGVNDSTAVHTWHALEKRGFRIPQDLSIIGFDDTDPVVNGTGVNLLTSVHLPLEEVGREAARLIVRRVTGEAPEDEHIVLPTRLIARASTAPPAT